MTTKLSPSTVKVGDVLTGGRKVGWVGKYNFYYHFPKDPEEFVTIISWREANYLGFQVEKKEEDWAREFDKIFHCNFYDFDGQFDKEPPIRQRIKNFIEDEIEVVKAQERAEIIRKAEGLRRENEKEDADYWYGFRDALDDLIKIL